MLDINGFMSQLGSLGGSNGATSYAAPTTPGPIVQGNNAMFSPIGSPTAATSNGFGLNMGTAQLGLAGLSALAGLIQGRNALGLAKDQFNFTKDVTNTNLNNQVKAYNTTLEDRLRSRGVAEGTDAAAVAAQIERNRLSR